MIESTGRNHFINNLFDDKEWSAPVLQTPDEVSQTLKGMRLEGRIIKDIIAVGIAFDWWTTGGFNKENAASIHQFECSAEIDAPILIEFEDGDVLAVLYCDGGTCRLSLNTLPPGIDSYTKHKNFHANRLFSDVLGKRICSVKVGVTNVYPDFSGAYGGYPLDFPPYINYIDIVYSTAENTIHTLRFHGWDDYGYVFLLDESNEILLIPEVKLPWIKEGFQ